MLKQLSIVICSLVVLVTLYAKDDHHPEPYVGSQEFQKMKSLVGTWEGSQMMEGKEQKTSVEYDLSSNGSALIEKIFCGAAHEMISIYHERRGKLNLTHYCALANQPNLVLTKSGDSEIEFEFGGYNDIDPDKDWHIHSLKIIFQNDNKIIQEWTSLKNGKAEDPTRIELTRVI